MLDELCHTLGVARDATHEDIRKAYKKLARECHPDKNPSHDAKRMFQEVSLAYEILTDPNKRSVLADAERLSKYESRPPCAFAHDTFGVLSSLFRQFGCGEACAPSSSSSSSSSHPFSASVAPGSSPAAQAHQHNHHHHHHPNNSGGNTPAGGSPFVFSASPAAQPQPQAHHHMHGARVGAKPCPIGRFFHEGVFGCKSGHDEAQAMGEGGEGEEMPAAAGAHPNVPPFQFPFGFPAPQAGQAGQTGQACSCRHEPQAGSPPYKRACASSRRVANLPSDPFGFAAMLNTGCEMRCSVGQCSPTSAASKPPPPDVVGGGVPPPVLPAGTRVKLVGLGSNPEFNGKVGTVVQYDHDLGRYVLCIAGKTRRLLPQNVKPIGGCVCVLDPLSDLHNVCGEVVGWVPSERKYKVQVCSRVVKLKPGNVGLSPGTMVMVCGVQGPNGRVNGQFGEVVALGQGGTYEVRCANGETMPFLPDNLRLAGVCEI